MNIAVSLERPLRFPTFITEVKVNVKIAANSPKSEDSPRVTDSTGVVGVV